MSLLHQLANPKAWEQFYEYKCSLAVSQRFTKELRKFIDEGRYQPICDEIQAGQIWPLPKKSVISKMGTNKKRVVYTYPYNYNMVLKLLTYLLLRNYDHLYANGLYSFRPGRTAKDGMRYLLRQRNLNQLYAYKTDIHDYFNSIDPSRLLPMLEEVLQEDKELFLFLKSLLLEPCVLEKGQPVEEWKGIMAGTPVASFYANLYLRELDQKFMDAGVIYVRYSDDIIVCGQSMEAVKYHSEVIKSFLQERGLTLNPDKEHFYTPEEGFTFLGFSYQKGTVDIAPITVKKLKAKMRRKRDSLVRWGKRKGAGGANAAKAFIRIFNRKLLEHAEDNELSWAQWFFPVITTTKSLEEIDHYEQDCIRYLVSGRHTKSRFNVRYEDMKALGYRNLVHAYYDE